MAEIIQNCPVCHEKLSVATLHCNNCGLSLQNDFQLNQFNYLTPEQVEFLLAFLQCQGSIKTLQAQLGLSYPQAKKRLRDLLRALDLAAEDEGDGAANESIDLNYAVYEEGSLKPSDVIKRQLAENGGRAVVYSITGKPYRIRIGKDGKLIDCPELPPYEFSVFDTVVECLVKNGGSAPKGNGRNYKLGEPLCDDSTIVGYIGKHYSHKSQGDSVFDPVFVLAAVLDWANIARNCRGYVELTPEYQARLG